MRTQAEENFGKNCHFLVSYRYEFFYSLNALLDPNARIHPKWRRTAQAKLGKEFDEHLKTLGGAWEIFPVLPALLPGSMSDPKFDAIKKHFREMPIRQFKEKILRGLLHSEEITKSLLNETLDLKSAMAKAPKAKQEWLAHIGLYPYHSKTPIIIALELLLKNPKQFREIILKIMDLYWTRVFERTWLQLQPQLQKSQEASERLFLSCSFSEYAKQSLLRIEVDNAKGEIKAIRGGYRLKLDDVVGCYFLPSAFNDRRFWSAFDESDEETFVYFPCFDPHITLDIQLAGGDPKLLAPALDPALIFKALGDSTRFAIVSILARSPTSSAELAKTLSVSKPTISHHVHILREAGLLEEVFSAGSVELSLKRPTIEKLSDLAIKTLFENEKPIQIQRSRGDSAQSSKVKR